jgi:hypothetical protein
MIQIKLLHLPTEHFFSVFVNNTNARYITNIGAKKLANLNCPKGCQANSTINIHITINGDRDIRFEDDFCCQEFREYAYSIYDVPAEIKKIHDSLI